MVILFRLDGQNGNVQSPQVHSIEIVHSIASLLLGQSQFLHSDEKYSHRNSIEVFGSAYENVTLFSIAYDKATSIHGNIIVFISDPVVVTMLGLNAQFEMV